MFIYTTYIYTISSYNFKPSYIYASIFIFLEQLRMYSCNDCISDVVHKYTNQKNWQKWKKKN